MRHRDTSGYGTTREAGRSQGYGKLVIGVLLCLILAVGSPGSVRGALGGAQLFGVNPVDYFRDTHRETDIYTFEISALDAYNLDQIVNGAEIKIGPGPNLFLENHDLSTNDVMMVEGLQPNSFGIVIPTRKSRCKFSPSNPRCLVDVQASLGVLTDGDTVFFNGINQGVTFAAVEIDVVGSDPLEFAFCGVVPFDTGVLTFGRTEKGDSPHTFFYPDTDSADCVVERGLITDSSGNVRDRTKIRSRPTPSPGLFGGWDIIQNSAPIIIIDPGVDGILGTADDGGPILDFIPSWGVAGLDTGGIIIIDNVQVSGFSGSAEQEIIDTINESFDLEIDAFVELNKDPAKAENLILSASSKLTDAVLELTAAMDRGTLQPSTRADQALEELQAAGRFDFDAFNALRAGNTSEVGDLLIKAAEHKARAELFLDGHNPQPAPIPNGTGGFDDLDPIFADGFESGDVSAWSTGRGG